MRSALQWLLMVAIVLNGPLASAFAHAARDGGRDELVAVPSESSDTPEHCAGKSATAASEQAPEPAKEHHTDSCQGGTCHCGCAGVTAVPLPELTLTTDVAPETIDCADDVSAPPGRVAAPFRPPAR